MRIRISAKYDTDDDGATVEMQLDAENLLDLAGVAYMTGEDAEEAERLQQEDRYYIAHLVEMVQDQIAEVETLRKTIVDKTSAIETYAQTCDRWARMHDDLQHNA